MFSVLDSTPTIANEEEESRKSVESFPPMGGVHCVLLCETGLCFFVVFLSVRPDTCQACGQRYVETTERQQTGNSRKADFRMVVLASDWSGKRSLTWVHVFGTCGFKPKNILNHKLCWIAVWLHLVTNIQYEKNKCTNVQYNSWYIENQCHGTSCVAFFLSIFSKKRK